MGSIRRLAGLLVVVGLSAPASAQIVNPSILQFDSADHAALVPAGEVSAGSAKVTGYQALLLLSTSDAVTGPVVAAGVVLPKAAVAASPVAVPPNPAFQVTLAQLGIVIPPCTTLPCVQYALVLTAIGPGGTSLRGGSSATVPFTASVPAPTSLPAAPLRVVVK